MTDSTPTSASVDRLRRAVAAFLGLVSDVRGDEWTRPTPCDGWDVRALLNHVVGGNALFTRLMQGEPLPEGDALVALRARDFLGDDPAAAFAAGGEALVAAFERPGVLEQVIPAPIGAVPGAVVIHLRVTELLVHGWDLARAIGRGAHELPADLAEEELAFSRGAIGQLPADRTPFAPPQPVAGDAPAIDRLAALLGRGVDAAGQPQG